MINYKITVEKMEEVDDQKYPKTTTILEVVSDRIDIDAVFNATRVKENNE